MGLELEKVPMEVVIKPFHSGNPLSDVSPACPFLCPSWLLAFFCLLTPFLPARVHDLWGQSIGAAVALPGSGPGAGETDSVVAGGGPHGVSDSPQEEGEGRRNPLGGGAGG